MLIGVIAEELLDPLSIKPNRWIDGFLIFPDRFPQARLAQIGYLIPGLVDETDLLFGVEGFPTTYITQDYFGIWPDLLVDPDVPGYDITSSGVPTLLPLLVIDLDFTPIIIVTNTAVQPRLFVDTDAFFSPTLTANLGPDIYSDLDVIRPDVIRRDGDDIVLLVDTFTDTDIIYAALMPAIMFPSMISDIDIFYPPSQVTRLASALFTADDVFYTAVLLEQIRPQLVVGDDVFIGPELRTPGRMGLVVDDDLFPITSVAFAPLAPPLLLDSDQILVPVIGSNPAIWPWQGPVVDPDEVYPPAVSQNLGLAPVIWIDVDDIKSIPHIILGQGLAPAAVFNDADAIYAPVLPLVLTPALFTDADNIFVPLMVFDQFPAPSWLIDTDLFYVPVIVALVTQVLTPSLISDIDTVPAPITTLISTFTGILSVDGAVFPGSTAPAVIIAE